MTYVVTGVCKDCKYTSCAAVCPVEAFHEADDILYIDPDTCIDCNACQYECPIDAIYPDYDVPEKHKEWIGINATEATKHPVIVNTKSPLKGTGCVDPSK